MTTSAVESSAGSSPRPLAGKVALVTGGGRGIGRGISRSLAEAGCDVVVNYFRKRAEAEETAAEIAAMGVRSIAIKANIGDDASPRRMVDDAIKALGAIDILVANAASGVIRPVTELETKAWDWTMDINARGFLTLAQAVAPGMRAKGWGRIVTISSLGSMRVYRDYAAVGASKAALEALTRYLAVDLAPHGIICNCVSPGLVITGALEHFPMADEMIEHAQRTTPAGRLVTPADVGALVVWLCSAAAAMIVGQTIQIDGGYTLVVGR